MKPFRILHVVGSMNRAGVETWLMHVLRRIDRQRFQADFLVHTDLPSAYESEILALGSRILRCPHTRNPPRFARRFLEIARHDGPFDALHGHVQHFNGFVLALGRIAGIPVRIAHSHTIGAEAQAPLARKLYLRAMERLIRRYSTDGLAASEPAAVALFGPRWREDPRFRVLHCGIDLAPFRLPIDSAAVRAELGFSPDDPIFAHVGRFVPEKNHLFLLQVARCILHQKPRAKFLFVGDGPLRPEVEKRAGEMGLKDRIVFAGPRPDIPRLMMGAMDVFLMPSRYEGLGLVVVEAQAAGLPYVSSDAVPEEATVNPALAHRLPLSAGPREWARVACEITGYPHVDRQRAVDMLDASRFDIRLGIERMCDIYLQGAARVRFEVPALESPVGRTRG